jgi:protein associated with RNAse G/E
MGASGIQTGGRLMRIGDRISVEALRYDGTPYRWWRAHLESISETCIVTLSWPGDVVNEPTGSWNIQTYNRGHYWIDRPFVLIESYGLDHAPLQLYVHVASPTWPTENGVAYKDYELDVIKQWGGLPQIVDERDFEDASERYGYSSRFITDCRAAAVMAVKLVDTWAWRGCPSERATC